MRCTSIEPRGSLRRRNEQGGQVRLAVAGHGAECNARIGQQHGLDPFGADVSAERRDEETVLASVYGNETVLIDLSEVTGAPRSIGGSLAEVAVCYRGSVDDDFSLVNRDREPA